MESPTSDNMIHPAAKDGRDIVNAYILNYDEPNVANLKNYEQDGKKLGKPIDQDRFSSFQETPKPDTSKPPPPV